MTATPEPDSSDYTSNAHRAILQAVRDQHDFGGWIAGVLASVSADLGSTFALTAERPGSWEANLIQQLVKGTVGYNDDYLSDYNEPLS
ncbi:MAG: hypothetical protein ACRDNK_02030 [Solirubrobacteraceae bacterium]